MKSNRRKFLQYSGLAGMSLAATNLIKSYASAVQASIPDLANLTPKQHFNMSGYAAPKLDVVRIGFIGFGNRGPAAVERMRHIEGVEIKALCDIRPDKGGGSKKDPGRLNAQT